MKQWLFFIVIMSSTSCFKGNKPLSDKGGLAIEIFAIDAKGDLISVSQINNQDSIDFFIDQINHGNQQTIKFNPTHKVKIKYKNGLEQEIFAGGNVVRIDRKVYRISKSIETIISQ